MKWSSFAIRPAEQLFLVFKIFDEEFSTSIEQIKVFDSKFREMTKFFCKTKLTDCIYRHFQIKATVFPHARFIWFNLNWYLLFGMAALRVAFLCKVFFCFIKFNLPRLNLFESGKSTLIFQSAVTRNEFLYNLKITLYIYNYI